MMEGKFVRPKSIRVLFTAAQMIDFSFPPPDDDQDRPPSVENVLPPPDDFEEDGTWQLL